MSRWSDFYAGRGGDDYLAYARERYAPFIAAIRDRITTKFTKTPDRVVELGCGTATITRAIYQCDALYYATDTDREMLKMADNRLRGRAEVRWHDAREPVMADIVHSHGLLEHFDDRTIRAIVSANRSYAKQLHYVPGLYPAPSFGDERLMSVEQWRDICHPDDVITFNDGLDYILVFNPKATA